MYNEDETGYSSNSQHKAKISAKKNKYFRFIVSSKMLSWFSPILAHSVQDLTNNEP